jgi:hypothetical protein
MGTDHMMRDAWRLHVEAATFAFSPHLPTARFNDELHVTLRTRRIYF